jgi:hypothetical protein
LPAPPNAPSDAASKPKLRIGRGGKSPRSLKQHIMRRLIMVVPLALLMVVMSRTGLLDFAADKMTFTDLSWFDNTALVEHLRVLVTHDGLTDEPGKCLVFLVNGDDPPNASHIDVLARHEAACPGKKTGLPDKLFTLRIDRADRTIETDAGTPGQFRMIPTK